MTDQETIPEATPHNKSKNRGKSLISFDYAIKYLLRNKGDYSIVEGFISALLKTQGYKDVKIIALLESESNKEDSKSKKSLADLIVEDEDRNKYIIEIERNLQEGFVHKACFNTARLIVDNIAEGADYTQIVKVFHISLLHFAIGDNPIYKGHTIIHDIETNKRLDVHVTNQANGKRYDAVNIFPEYFFISIPSFNDRLKKDIDEWLYVMKHDHVPDNYKSPYMKLVEEKLNILKMTIEERNEYYSYMKKLHTDKDELTTAKKLSREEGIEEGIERGVEKSRRAMVINMINEGADESFILRVSKLSPPELHEIKKSISV